MADYIVRATAANNQIRAFAATTKETGKASDRRSDDGKHDEK